MFAKFVSQKIKKKKMPCVSICEQNLAYSSNFEQYFLQKLWKIIQFLERIFKVLFNLYFVTQFHYDHIFTTKMMAVENGLSK